MTDWTDLGRELDAWAAGGARATVWWRDDDATEPTPALDRLLDMAAARALPLTVAVIPARASPALATRLAAAGAAVTPVQHGFAHRNHAPDTEKKAELGPHRPAAAVRDELARGWTRLVDLFGAAVRPILVPPWNRIDDGLLSDLPELGYRALSTYGPRPAAMAAPDLARVNCHLDLMRWEAPRGFAGEGVALDLLLAHLRGRRAGVHDATEPSGILSHHLAHDAAAWDFLDRLLRELKAHPAVRFVGIAQAVAAGTAAGRAA